MPKKGVLSVFTHHRNHHHHHGHNNPQRTFSAMLMEDNITNAEPTVSKWDINSPQTRLTPLFHDDRDEARRFCQAVRDLHRAMVFFSSEDCSEGPKSRSHSLVRAQALMQSAMRRLEKEFHRILSANRDRLDPESVSHGRSVRSSVSDQDSEEDEVRTAGHSIGEVEQASERATSDLRTIAQTMVSAGYGRECVRIYNALRRSIVDEGLYRLGFEDLTPSQIQKLDWEVLDLKIRSWLAGSRIAIRTLLAGERILCDHVFEGSDPIRESCFAEIAKDPALRLLRFPELAAKTKKSPEKLFRTLDLYDALSDLWLDVESVFSFDSTAVVRSQALSTLLKLGEAARQTVAEFESAIQKEGSKNAVPGGGVHPLTRYAMNYLVFLADYDFALSDVFLDFPLQIRAPLPESFFDSSTISSPLHESNPSSSISIRFAWLILNLLCKLDGKAEIYKEVALSYLFLANNLHYVVKKVKGSKLGEILGQDWIFKHESKTRHYASSYERLAWSRIAAAVPSPAESPTRTAAAERIRFFYAVLEEAVRVQRDWVVNDETMRREIRETVAEFIVPAYRGFYEAYRPTFSDNVAVLRYAPEQVRAMVMGLFRGSGESGSGFGYGSDSASMSGKSSCESPSH